MAPSYESCHQPGTALDLHRHREAYAALVLDGGYHEMSIDGRYACARAALVIHPAWHAHTNAFGGSGAVVLNFPVPGADGATVLRVSDVGALERLARNDPLAASHAAMEESDREPALSPAPWLVRLASMLGRDDDTDITALARRCGVSAAHASRACKRWFGVGPAALRREGRLRRAMHLLRRGALPAEAAAAAGFSDQPHLSRLLKRATGCTPGRFRNA